MEHIFYLCVFVCIYVCVYVVSSDDDAQPDNIILVCVRVFKACSIFSVCVHVIKILYIGMQINT